MKRLLLALALVVLVASGCENSPPYAAVVNGEVIRSSTVQRELEIVTSNPEFVKALEGDLSAQGGFQAGGDNTVNAQYTAQLVYGRVLGTLLKQELERTGGHITDEQRAKADASTREAFGDTNIYATLDPEYRNYLSERQASLDAVIAARNTPEAQRKYFDADPNRFARICVRHVLVESEAHSNDVRNRLVAGGDFAAIANAESLDNPAARGGQPNSGDLGCFSMAELEDFVAPFRDAAKVLPTGEFSQPVQTNFGYHVIQVVSKTGASFEEVRAGIEQQLANPTQLFSELLNNAKLKVNPRYGDYTPGTATTPGRINPHQQSALQPKPEEPESSGVGGPQDPGSSAVPGQSDGPPVQ